MRLPLTIVSNGLGEPTDAKDAADVQISFRVDPDEDATLVGFADGGGSLPAGLKEVAAVAAELRRHLWRFSQPTEWRYERGRLMRGPNDASE